MSFYQIQTEGADGAERAEFERQQAEILARRVELTPPFFSYVLIGCFVAVFLVQLYVGEDKSVDAAGLVKPLVWKGDYWRLLTSSLLHGGYFLHLYFNSQALFNIGSMIEALSNRAHVAICFLLAGIGGSIASLYLMPDTNSIGASGGVIGLFGFLGVYGYKNKAHLPPNFLRNIVINLLFIAVIGVIGYNFIDNAAHAGGLVTGAIYGLLIVRRNEGFQANKVPGFVTILGYVSLLTIVAAAIFAVMQILTFR